MTKGLEREYEASLPLKTGGFSRDSDNQQWRVGVRQISSARTRRAGSFPHTMRQTSDARTLLQYQPLDGRLVFDILPSEGQWSTVRYRLPQLQLLLLWSRSAHTF